MPLRIHQSNRLEILSELLARQMRKPLSSTLTPEVIIVQSRGMAQWISLELARLNGICANCTFPFPEHFLRKLAAALSTPFPQDDPYTVEMMTVRIMKLLPQCLDLSEFKDLSGYLSDDATQEKTYQIAAKIADLFDQYMVFRPEMILSWDQRVAVESNTHRWQSILWRMLVEDTASSHRVLLQQQLLERIYQAPASLPERLTLFAVTYMPRFHLTVLAALSETLPVTLYYLNPCREYWAEILTESESQRIVQGYQANDLGDDLYYLEGGNPLLATLGKLGREFQYLISGMDCDIHDHFQAASHRSLLGRVQTDILNLKDPTTGSPGDKSAGSEPPGEIGSIRINACHSRMREMEVLHDQMLAWFESDADLTPSDIVVMAPDIEIYAPYVKAVFGSGTQDPQRIFYSIADRASQTSNPVYEAFSQLLDLHQSRLGAAQVISLLDIPAVKTKWQFTGADVETATEWIDSAGIRWGADAGHRNSLGFGDSEQNTWQAGLQRLMLGYAMTQRPPGLFSHIVPEDRIEGRDALLLGNLMTFLQRIIHFSQELDDRKTLIQWRQFLLQALDAFIQPEENEQEAYLALQQSMVELGELQQAVDMELGLTIRVVRRMLERLMNRALPSTGFLAGGVTFCTLLPMRSVPFKVVCLVGMNHEAFPRQSAAVEFDLIQRHPRIGDRSRRKDDMHMFLEAILAARQIFYISYIGRDKQDNTAKPPSVLVNELLDILKRGYGLDESEAVCQHRLQAFSPEYFEPESHRLFSFSEDNLAAARKLVVQTQSPPAFIAQALPAPPPESRILELMQLCRFYSHPARYLLHQRLEVYLEDETIQLNDRENFRLEGLERFQMEQSIFTALSAGESTEMAYRRQRSLGQLPHGNVGRLLFERMWTEAEMVIAKARRLRRGKPPRAESVYAEIGPFSLKARLTDLYPLGQVLVRYKHLRAKDLMAAWIHHLVYCSAVQRHDGHDTFLVGKDRLLHFTPLRQPLDRLAKLLEFYEAGMRAPLPFFPETSHIFAKQRMKQKKPIHGALKDARNKWLGSDFAMGEGQDPYLQLCFGHGDPLDQRFEEIALAVFTPLEAHMDQLGDADG